MSDEVSGRRGERAALEGERESGVPCLSESRRRHGTAPRESTRKLDAYEEGLERYFELSSRLASRRVDGGDEDDEYTALRAEATELGRELSEISRELSVTEIGAVLRE